MEIYIREQHYDNKDCEFKVNPSLKTIYDLDVTDIEEFYIHYFSYLNQFPLYITFQWYDDDLEGMKEILDKADVVYSHKYIPQNRAFRLTERGDVYYDILIFTVEVIDKIQLEEIISNVLVTWHLFIISDQNNVSFGEKFFQEDSIQFELVESTTFCLMQCDVPGTYLITNQFRKFNELIESFPKEWKVIKDEG